LWYAEISCFKKGGDVMPKKEPLRGVCYFHSETGTEGGYWAFAEKKYKYVSPEGYEGWAYEGLHILKDGDYLKIFSLGNPTVVVWEGTISLIPYPPFTESAFGFWIHADQEDIDRETWAAYFLYEFPAELTPA